jgi:alcohol dehydrogenase (NADP+)
MAAPMLCAGLTLWSPLVRANIGPGKTVAVVGMGGLGHFAVIWAAALGAEVSVISHSPSKKDDAIKLGAKTFIINSGKGWAKPPEFSFDFILNTANMTHQFDIGEYLSLCKVNGSFHQVAVPEEPLPQFQTQVFMKNGSSIGASHIGSRPECLAMLKLAAEKKLFSIVERIPISAEGCKEAVSKVKDGKVRYRVTLTGYDEAFGA